MVKKTVKCRYKYCKHESQDIPREEAVKGSGSNYFHPDCYKERQNKEDTIKLFLDEINPDTPVPQLRRVVNNIVHDKGIDSEYLKFALQYYIKNKIKLNYPYGLYYAIANEKVESDYKRLKNQGRKYDFNITEDVYEEFVYSKSKRKSLDNFMDKG